MGPAFAGTTTDCRNSIRPFSVRYNRRRSNQSAAQRLSQASWPITHDHQDHSAHAHGHAGHSHAPDNFGFAFAVGVALNTAFVVAELVFGYAANSLALISDAVHNFSDVIALLLAWARGWLAQQAADRAAHLWLPAGLDPGGAGQCRPAADRGRRHRGRSHQPDQGAGRGRGLDRGVGRRARHRRQRRHRAVVHARPPRRPQYPRRLSAHGGRCRRLRSAWWSRLCVIMVTGWLWVDPAISLVHRRRGAGERLGPCARQRQSRARRRAERHRAGGGEGLSRRSSTASPRCTICISGP